ncbi:hypothetical protein GGR51DRAFT_565026 [Nemania sp. FL0031]|nr:hypothetical protein GGR51DRAFT_565026 [Nemania sp. FL0031]
MAPFLENMFLIPYRRSSRDGGSCPHPRAAPTLVTLDPYGDMMLVVGKPKCTDMFCNEQKRNKQPDHICFHVNSAVVAGASPAFGLVLYSPSTEAPRADGVRWTVKLPDDDPQAMQVIINILYGQYPVSTLDTHMDIDQLLKLTVLANKYDLVHLFPRWVAQWVLDMEPYWVGRKFVRKSTEDLEVLLWIFWVLGHEPLYTYMILQIAFYSELDAAGKLTDPAEQLCFTNEYRYVPVPPCAPVEIGHARIQALMLIRKDIKETLEEHLHGSDKPSWLRCRRMDGSDDWGWRESVMVSLFEMLEAEGIWPLPSAYALTASPRSLVELFRVNPNIPAFMHHHDGRYCDADGTFWEHIEKLLLEVNLALPVASTYHLGRQAMKSGLTGYFKSKGFGLSSVKGNWSLREIMEFQKAVAESECGGKLH